MTTYYGRQAYRVTASQVSSVDITGGTIISQGDVDGGFEVRFQHDLGGCGNPDSGIFVAIRDFVSWTWMSVDFMVTGTASCWSFNHPSYGAAVGNGATGNILTYNESLGDKCVKTYLAQEDAAYSSHDKVTACDNDSNNFMRYTGETFRRCTFVRRRNVNGQLAGPHHGRSCNSTGSGSMTVIKNIYVWL